MALEYIRYVEICSKNIFPVKAFNATREFGFVVVNMTVDSSLETVSECSFIFELV